jgi:phosphoglycerate dehydrogenase-like enzyme
MPRVLLADYEFPDLALERALYADARTELVAAQCRTEAGVIAAGSGCVGILLQAAPITEKVVAALPQLGIVGRIGAGVDTVDTQACARHGGWVANAPITASARSPRTPWRSPWP